VFAVLFCMTFLRKSLIVNLVALAGLLPNAAFAAQPVHARQAMVASVHESASQAGIDVLKAGGNAVDAAVAVGFALAVVHPQAGNLGGGGFLLFRDAQGKIGFIDFREMAPAAATRDMYLDAQGSVIAEASVIGYKAIAVPGSVAGLTYAHKKWGKLPLKRVMEPAIRLAKKGFRLNYADAQDLADSKLGEFPESRRIFQRDGKLYQQDEVLRQPELAKTLKRIAKDPDEFYHGKIARQFAEDMQKNGGLITADDLARYEVKEREPLRGTYRGYEIVSAPPPSSGGVVLLEALNMLEGFDLSSLGSRSADSIHLTAEAFRRAYMDRAELLGDPDFAKVPVAQLIDKKYAAAWRESINPAQASVSTALQRPAGTFNELDRMARRTLPRSESADTTHYSVVDAEGNAVAVTTTLNDSFGSRVTATGLGFLLNNEMDDFAAKPGTPNMYGLIQGEANAIAPGKRPLSSMTPTIVTKDGKLLLVLGSPGGEKIITTVANTLMAVVDYGMNIQDAVNAPRFHHQWMPDSLTLETVGFSPDTVKILESRGHKIERVESWSDGECIAVDPATGERLGASDPRNPGRAVGY
jgi:gamma-glutamyltranspeptidase/glutathione hydrolase